MSLSIDNIVSIILTFSLNKCLFTNTIFKLKIINACDSTVNLYDDLAPLKIIFCKSILNSSNQSCTQIRLNYKCL